MPTADKPTFFATHAALRQWLERHHASLRELYVGFYKRGSGHPSISWPESVDAALCFGWIDGVRKRIDGESYVIRFTPRRPSSKWSAVNVKRVGELKKLGLMQPAGLKAFENRTSTETHYSYEQRITAALSPEDENQLRADRKAWEYFQAQPPSYRRTASWWVISAKKAETRQRRLVMLMESCRNQRPVPPMASLVRPKR